MNLAFMYLENNTIMSDKEFLERMLSMLPEEFQDIYDDTIPEAKEVRKKMGKKTSSVPSYSCAMPMLDDIRSLRLQRPSQGMQGIPSVLDKESICCYLLHTSF